MMPDDNPSPRNAICIQCQCILSEDRALCEILTAPSPRLTRETRVPCVNFLASVMTTMTARINSRPVAAHPMQRKKKMT